MTRKTKVKKNTSHKSETRDNPSDNAEPHTGANNDSVVEPVQPNADPKRPEQDALTIPKTVRMTSPPERKHATTAPPDPPHGRSIPLQIDSDEQPMHSDTRSKHSGSRPANQSVLGLRLVQFWEKLRSHNMPIARIAKMFGVSSSTVEYWAGSIEPQDNAMASDSSNETPQQPNPSEPPRSTIPEAIVDESNDSGIQERPMPRLNSEVFASRPQVLDENNGSEHASSMTIENGNPIQYTSSSPVDLDLLRIMSRQSEWLDVFLTIRGAARQAGYDNPILYFNRRMWQDSQDMDFFRTLFPYDPDDPESLRENAALIVRKSNAFDEATRRSGLINDHQSQQRREQP